jgi:hypothetical protein
LGLKKCDVIFSQKIKKLKKKKIKLTLGKHIHPKNSQIVGRKMGSSRETREW